MDFVFNVLDIEAVFFFLNVIVLHKPTMNENIFFLEMYGSV